MVKTLHKNAIDEENEKVIKKVILPYEKSGEYSIKHIDDISREWRYYFIKRTFDIILSFICLVILFIPMVFIGLAIKIMSPGSIFYFQERLGKNGRKFKIIKFRSMIEDAEHDGPQWCIDENDERITKIGRVLRKYYLDELPQLWCVLVGDMSFVGPRPERECFYKEFETYIHGFSERLRVKPGLTGFAQVEGDFATPPEKKIMYDIEYIKRRSILFDIKILIKTIYVVFKK